MSRLVCQTWSTRLRYSVAAFSLTAAFCISVQGCGSGTEPHKPTPAVATTISVVGGDGQTARINSAVAVAPSVVVKDQNGAPMAGVSVTFAVSAGGGALAGTSQTTNASGVATAGAWTLGKTPGANSLSATASGGANPSTQISATARPPLWTVMVYMAADNTLAVYGLVNLLQMANAGVNPEVQVVVQAEFSPTAFAQSGLSPSAVDRPNFNTFRYVMDGSASRPPNRVLIGPATDIGNVNMADPSTLHSFVQWGEQIAPSEHTILVLWNHGGDEQGLIEDETSAPGSVMTLSQLKSGLSGLPKFDVLYFEMCLMAGYEPLLAVRSNAMTVVASEDEEYVAGWDFGRFLNAIYADPTVSARTLATRLADTFDAAYAGLGLSETIAAFDMSGFDQVDAALSQLGTALVNTPSANLTTLATLSSGVQRYGYAYVADVVNLADSLQGFPDASVTSAATAAKQAVTSTSFLLANHYRTGTGAYQRDEARSHGLTVVMPSTGADALPSEGTASVAGYEQQFPGVEWGAFLQRYSAALPSQPYANIGQDAFAGWLVWDTSFVARGWLEMLLLEPDGNVYGPAFGTISPSGQFSADARASGAYYEGWAANADVAVGDFFFIAWLVADSSNVQPFVDFDYAQAGSPLQSLYQPGPYPQLSMAHSALADPNATWDDVLNGKYTDLVAVATWSVPAPAASVAHMNQLIRPSIPRAAASPRVSPAQMAFLRRAATAIATLRRQYPKESTDAIRRRLRDFFARAPR
jgi:cysteine peptidase C11 family protein